MMGLCERETPPQKKTRQKKATSCWERGLFPTKVGVKRHQLLGEPGATFPDTARPLRPNKPLQSPAGLPSRQRAGGLAAEPSEREAHPSLFECEVDPRRKKHPPRRGCSFYFSFFFWGSISFWSGLFTNLGLGNQHFWRGTPPY